MVDLWGSLLNSKAFSSVRSLLETNKIFFDTSNILNRIPRLYDKSLPSSCTIVF